MLEEFALKISVEVPGSDLISAIKMGAAASVRMVYKDALTWFKQYIDAEVSDS